MKPYIPKQFPKMIYHLSDGREKVVKSQEEMQKFLNEGWSEDYHVKKLQDITREKIVWHKAEIKRLEALLPKEEIEEINHLPNIQTIVSHSKSSEVVEVAMPVKAAEDEIQPPVPAVEEKKEEVITEPIKEEQSVIEEAREIPMRFENEFKEQNFRKRGRPKRNK